MQEIMADTINTPYQYLQNWLSFITFVASDTKWTLIMVPCSDAVAMYIPLEERTIAANGERWASICNSGFIIMFMNISKRYKQPYISSYVVLKRKYYCQIIKQWNKSIQMCRKRFALVRQNENDTCFLYGMAHSSPPSPQYSVFSYLLGPLVNLPACISFFGS